MITGIASLIQRVAVYESTPGLAQRRDEKIDVKIRFSPRSEITQAGGGTAGRRSGGARLLPPFAFRPKSASDPCCAADGPSLHVQGLGARTTGLRFRSWSLPFQHTGSEELFSIKRKVVVVVGINHWLLPSGARLVFATMCH